MHAQIRMIKKFPQMKKAKANIKNSKKMAIGCKSVKHLIKKVAATPGIHNLSDDLTKHWDGSSMNAMHAVCLATMVSTSQQNFSLSIFMSQAMDGEGDKLSISTSWVCTA